MLGSCRQPDHQSGLTLCRRLAHRASPQGEVCTNATRVFVQRGIYDKFVAELVKRTQRARVGDPLSSDTTVGALISAEHMHKVLE